MKVGILGRNGLIGKSLWKKYPEAFNYLRPDLDIVYWFAAPSSQILFKSAPEYSWNETVSGFKNVLMFCAENNIKLVYPSSATVYNLNNDYAKCKAHLEKLQEDHPYKNVLGLRIFAGYGHEYHKGEYASIIYQFCKLMKHGKRPIIFGDGNQTRDFIYVEDVVENMIRFVEEGETGVKDIGTGIATSFNEVVGIINEELGSNIQPVYVDKPKDYIEETICKDSVPVRTSLREGIREVL